MYEKYIIFLFKIYLKFSKHFFHIWWSDRLCTNQNGPFVQYDHERLFRYQNTSFRLLNSEMNCPGSKAVNQRDRQSRKPHKCLDSQTVIVASQRDILDCQAKYYQEIQSRHRGTLSRHTVQREPVRQSRQTFYIIRNNRNKKAARLEQLVRLFSLDI